MGFILGSQKQSNIRPGGKFILGRKPVEKIITPSVTKQRSLTSEPKKKFSLSEVNKLWKEKNKNNVKNFIDKAADFNDVAGATMRATVFGDTEDIVGGKKNATTGNKNLDNIAKASGMVESFFIPASEGGLFANATRKGAEGIVENIAAKTGSKILKNKLANRAAVGVVESVPYTAQQIGTQDMGTKEALKTAALNTGLGIAAEPFLVGASALVKGIAKRMKAGKALTQTEQAIVEKTPELKTYEQQLQDEITTPNPAQSEQIAEELRNAEPIKTVSQPERVIALKNLRMTMKEGTPEHTAISDAIDRLERETVASETPPVSAQPTAKQTPLTVDKTLINARKSYENGDISQKDFIRTAWNETAKWVDGLRKTDKKQDTFEVYWGHGKDTDRGYARYIDKYFADMPEMLQEFWGKQRVKDLETGEMLNGLEHGIRGGHVGQIRNYIDEIGDVENATPPASALPTEGKVNTPPTVEKPPATSQAPKTPNQQKYVEQFTARLPETEKELAKTISDIEAKLAVETDPQKKLKLDLQHFAASEKLKKVSQFRTNTIERSTMLTDEERAFLPDEDFEYDPEKAKDWKKFAEFGVRANPELAKAKILKAQQLSAEQEFEAAIISKQLLDNARKIEAETGSKSGYAELSNWLSLISAKTRESARALKAVDLAWEKTSPEAGIKRAQKIIDGVEDAIAKKDPGKIKRIDKGLAKIKSILEDNTLTPQEAVSQIKMILNPKGKQGKVTMDKIIEIMEKGKVDGKFDYDAIKVILKQKNGIPVLTNEEIAQIDQLYTKAKEYPKDSYENKMYIEKARRLVEDKIPTEFIDKFRAIQRISMIFNLKTLVTRNPGGNVLLMGLTQIKENTMGAFVDMLTSAIRKSERTTLFAPVTKGKAMAQGAAKGVKEWARDIKNNVDTNPTHGQLELQKGKVFKGENPASRILNEIDTIEKRLLQLGDRPFYEAAYTSRIAELKKIKKVTEITDEMRIDAKAYALDKVFQRDSELSKIFGGAKNLSQNTGFKVLANLIMPFSQTPANILDKMIEYSPGGVLKSIKELAFPKNGVFNQKYFVDNLSSGLTGTGILVLGYFMAKNKLITSKAPSSQKQRSFEQMQGKGNYALRFGDSYYTIDWAQPVATMLLAGAEMFNGSKGDDAFKKTLSSLMAAGDTFFNMSMLRNVSSLFGTGNSPMGSFINTLMGSSTQFTPTMGKQISQLIDPYVRETYDPNMLKEQYNKILARIPGLSKTLPIKRDAIGKEVKAYQGRNNFLNVMLNPGFFTKESDDPALKEIQRLYETDKDTDVLPGKEVLTSGKFTEKKVDYTMSAKELEQFAKTYGNVLQNGYTVNGIKYLGINSLINTPVYKRLNDKGKANRIKGIYDKAYEQAKAEFFKTRGVKP
jgi:hypothetical protein